MNASKIISKKVYSIYEGNEIGYVLNISLDEKLTQLKHFIVVSLYEETEMVLNCEDVVSLTEEAIFIDSEKTLYFDANLFPNNPMGKKIFSVGGDSLGRVEDIEINKLQVKKIIGSECEILPKHVFSCGNDCLFFSKNKHKKSKIFEKNSEIPVIIQNIALPYKEKDTSLDMIGKEIVKDILDQNHIIVFKKYTIISPKILIEAKRKGLVKKLSESIRM